MPFQTRWRQQNERFQKCCIAQHDQFGRGSVMVCAGISYNGCTDLQVFKNGTVNGQRYRDEILAPYVVPCAGAVVQEFILMDDNATAHQIAI